MMILLGILSALMGVVLGLLGGGGSILAVPILLYVVGAGAKEAIATSLLVVGATSVACTVQHARQGNVRFRVGIVFGLFGMAGAYLGGFVARWIPGSILLWMFALMMVVAGIAMIRKRPDQKPGELSLSKAALEGLLVGAVTGLVGAGGGFLVVPALVLFGGLDMRVAVGTSALVIAMKSFAGFAGYISHATINYEVAAVIVLCAVAGSLVGVWLVQRLDPSRLKKLFGAFVLLMAGVMAYAEAGASVKQALFADRWPFWVAGIAIGLFVVVFLLSTRKALGVSTGFMDACAAVTDRTARTSWRLPFIVGLVLGGIAAATLAGAMNPTMAMGMFDAAVSSSLAVKIPVFVGGGVMIGFGARLAGGCTSGHGIVGMSLAAPSSLLATGAFMVAGFAVTQLLLGGLS